MPVDSCHVHYNYLDGLERYYKSECPGHGGSFLLGAMLVLEKKRVMGNQGFWALGITFIDEELKRRADNAYTLKIRRDIALAS